MPDTIYLLFYDTDSGSREEWNTFYTPCEVFLSSEDRETRITYLSNLCDEDGDPYSYIFHKINCAPISGSALTEPPRDDLDEEDEIDS